MRILPKIFKRREERNEWLREATTREDSLLFNRVKKSKIHFIFNTKSYFTFLKNVKTRFGMKRVWQVIAYSIWDTVCFWIKLVLKVSIACIILSLFTKGTYRLEDIPYGEVRAIYHKTSFVMKNDTIVYESGENKQIGKVIDTYIPKTIDKKGMTATLEDGTVVDFSKVKGVYWGKYTTKTAYENMTEEEQNEDMGIHGEADTAGEFFYGLFKYALSFHNDYTILDRIEVGAKGTYYTVRGWTLKIASLAGIGTD